MGTAVRCPKCRTKLSVPDDSAGRRFKCQCGAVLRVGGEGAGAAAPSPAPRKAAPPRESRPRSDGRAGDGPSDDESFFDEEDFDEEAFERDEYQDEDSDDRPARRRARQGRRGRGRVAAGRQGSSTGLYVGLGVAALVAVAAGIYLTGGGGGKRKRRPSTRVARTETTVAAAAGTEAKGTGDAAARSTAASPPSAAQADAPAASPAVSEAPASPAIDTTAATTVTVDEPPATAEAAAPAPEPAPPPTAEEPAPVEPIPVETAEFTPPEVASAVEVSPVKWPAGKAKGYLSPTDVVADPQGKKIYVAQFTANQVAMFDAAGGGTGKIVPVGGPPGGLAISPDGKRLYVACSSPEGTVEILDAESGAKLGRVRVGHTPVAVVVSPDGGTLYVCNRFNNDVSVVDVASKRETKRIKVANEPVAAALTHLPVGRADGDTIAAAVSVIDTAAGKLSTNIKLLNGSTDLLGACVSPDGRYAYVTHILARHQVPTTQLERGWINTNGISIIDVRTQKLVNAVLLDDPDLGAANPWGVRCTADGRFICVTHAGTNELSVIDSQALHSKLARSTGHAVANDLMFMDGVRRRIRLPGEGPRGLAMVGMTAFVAQYFSDDLAAVNLATERVPKRTRSLSLGPTKSMTEERRGEWLFNTGTICFQMWQSCASCHPGARADGVNWDLLNDGMGNPRSAKSMLLAHRTPPVMVTGVRASAEVAVRAGIRFIHFADRPEEDAVAIDTYLKGLEPVPSPYLVDGKLSAAAQRGKRVFAKAGCINCHKGKYFTDMKKYDVGTSESWEADLEFDTPTLIEVWRTSPFLHDGRAATMLDVFKEHNKDDAHGTTQDLKDQELKDLAEFVLSQ
jgi:YVTN family beta-propeller protein